MAGIARERGLTTAFVPELDAAEAGLIDGMEVVPVPTLGSSLSTCAASSRSSRTSPSASTRSRTACRRKASTSAT